MCGQSAEHESFVGYRSLWVPITSFDIRWYRSMLQMLVGE